MTIKATITNKKVFPAAVFQVRHNGKNDYRIVLDGAGELSSHEQFGIAFSKANWFAALPAADLAHEVHNRTTKPCRYTDGKGETAMTKSTEELLFGKENQDLVNDAVKRAVARADAAGLPRAYKVLPLDNDVPGVDKAVEKKHES